MKPMAALTLLMLVLTLSSAASQQRRIFEKLRIGIDVDVFHADKAEMFNGVIPIVGPQDENEHDHESLEMLIGANPFILRRSYGLRNAAAAIDRKSGQRVIIWDPEWVGPGSYTLAHEAGHHVCRHTIAGHNKAPHEIELEADKHAGAVLRPGNIESVVEFMRKSFSSRGSVSHPPVEARIAALMDGYRNGSSCAVGAHQAIIEHRVISQPSEGIHNMRTGPGTGHALVVSIPASSVGVRVDMKSCRSSDDGISKYQWCRGNWRGHSGWLSLGGVVRHK